MQNVTAVKDLLPRDEIQRLVRMMRSGIHAEIDCKGFAKKVFNWMFDLWLFPLHKLLNSLCHSLNLDVNPQIKAESLQFAACPVHFISNQWWCLQPKTILMDLSVTVVQPSRQGLSNVRVDLFLAARASEASNICISLSPSLITFTPPLPLYGLWMFVVSFLSQRKCLTLPPRSLLVPSLINCDFDPVRGGVYKIEKGLRKAEGGCTEYFSALLPVGLGGKKAICNFPS